MTFQDIQNEVADRLDIVSPQGLTRVGRSINERYRRVTSSIGLETSRRVEIAVTATVGNRTINCPGIEKVIAVIDRTSSTTQDTVLEQVTFDEMHILPIRGDPPRHYCIPNMHANSVDLYIDSIPSTAFTLYIDGHTNVSTLSGNMTPDFPESFHDILIFGAMADGYRKMENRLLMQDAERNYEERLSSLRYFIAKSAYLNQHQGRYTGKSFRWTRDAQLVWSS